VAGWWTTTLAQSAEPAATSADPGFHGHETPTVDC
jgi:hypothetical protein